jgi:methylisocitrate lyase
MARSIRLLEQAGAAAVEIEDQVAPKRAHHHKGRGTPGLDRRDGRADCGAAREARRGDYPVVIVRMQRVWRTKGSSGLSSGSPPIRRQGAELLMALPRSEEQFEAISAGTTVPLRQ